MPLSIVVPDTAPLQEAALALLFSPLPPAQRQEQLADALAAVARKELSLEHLVTAMDGQQIVGTVLAVERPGGVAFLWPPVVSAGVPDGEVSLALLEAVAARVDAHGVHFTQCLLDPSDLCGRGTLDRGDIPYVTDLVLLSRSLAVNLPSHSSTKLSAERYSAKSHGAFARIVERTYEGTLDCPILARLRGGDASLAAHRATGRFSPDAWQLYRSAEEDVGVLLLAEHPERDTWEVAYLGVIPEARGRGIGEAILADGFARIQRSGRSTIEIAVDVQNTPALRLYRKLGFQDMRRFAVHLRVRPANV